MYIYIYTNIYIYIYSPESIIVYLQLLPTLSPNCTFFHLFFHSSPFFRKHHRRFAAIAHNFSFYCWLFCFSGAYIVRVCMCVRACVRAFVCACVCVCIRACV